MFLKKIRNIFVFVINVFWCCKWEIFVFVIMFFCGGGFKVEFFFYFWSCDFDLILIFI